MFSDNFETQCRLGCWGLGVFSGIVTLYLIAGLTGFLAALLVAIALAVFMALVLIQLFCWEDEEDDSATADSDASPATPPVPTPPTPAAPGAGVPAAGGDPSGGPTRTADVAARSATTTESAPAPSPAATQEPQATPDDAHDVETSGPAGAVKSGTLLKGEEEIANRKGEWKYEGDQASGAAASADATPDYDKDGVHEGTNEGTKPAGLDAARGGQPDNLKEIKGVGPKLEQLLNSMGFYHFDQIAAWSADEVAWVDANLQGFKGRVSRDNWIEQAKILAAGGETEFSKRVDEGDVY
ncbi:MAG: endonuclease [Pseudomonadota bacterium]